MLAYGGKILYIDLSSEQVWTHTLSTDLITRFLGGRGINAKLLWDLVKPETHPFSPDNRLIFGTGVLTCTTAPASGRMTVTCKSPATHLYLKSSGGGHVGAELKFAGYDHLVIQGKAKTPTVVVIENNDVSFINASEMWGSHIRKTNLIIKQKLKNPEFKIACIGPAGENLIPFASIMLSVYHAFGRGGAGAVMGSKQLKAIAIRGTGDIVVSKPQQFMDVAQRLREAFLNDTQGKKYFLFGLVS